MSADPPDPTRTEGPPLEATLERVYDHLRALAEKYLRGRAGHTLQATALVHEAFLRMAEHDGGRRFTPESRAHLLAVAATAMRQILVDHARKKGSAKRGGGQLHVSLSGQADQGPQVDLVVLNDALTRLARLDPRQARVVELRVFAGLTNDEVAAAIGVSLRTVESDWRKVRAWLAAELGNA